MKTANVKTTGELAPRHFGMVIGSILLLWLTYTVHFATYKSGLIYESLRFVPGVIGVGMLLASGCSIKECFLKVAPISRLSMVVYALMLLLMTPVVLTGLEMGGFSGIDLKLILLAAPIDAITQELYFRAALLPALLIALPRMPRLALGLQALLFAVYHIGMLRVAPVGVAISAMMLTFLVGLGWGWQVQRDGTVIWAMAHHTLLQIILKLFVWG
jgi:hypothetical protein